jgi:hypothetical protein
MDETRDLRGEVEQQFLAPHALFAEEQPMIAAEEDDGVRVEPVIFKIRKQAADNMVEAGDGLIIADVMFPAGGEVVFVNVCLIPATPSRLAEDSARGAIRQRACPRSNQGCGR